MYTRLWGWLNDLDLPVWLRSRLLSVYVNSFGCDMEEAERADLESYKNLGQLFRPPLGSSAAWRSGGASQGSLLQPRPLPGDRPGPALQSAGQEAVPVRPLPRTRGLSLLPLSGRLDSEGQETLPVVAGSQSHQGRILRGVQPRLDDSSYI